MSENDLIYEISRLEAEIVSLRKRVFARYEEAGINAETLIRGQKAKETLDLINDVLITVLDWDDDEEVRSSLRDVQRYVEAWKQKT